MGVSADIVASLVGLPVWSAVVGPAGQYVLSLEIGAQSRRPVRLANPRLSFVKRTFEGTHALLVECPWRLENDSGIVASAYEAFESAEDGAVVGEHPGFTDETIEKSYLDERTGDLTLVLSEGLIFRAIVLETRRRAPERTNWTLTSPDKVLSSGPGGRLLVRSRAEAEGAFKRMIRALEGGEDDLVKRLAKNRGMAAVPPLEDEPIEPTDEEPS